MTERKNIGPFTQGMNTLSNETDLPENQCRSAKDLNFDRDGNYSRRQGFTNIFPLSNVHSLYPSKSSAYIFGCQKNNLGVFDLLNLTFTPKIVMPSAFMTSWTELDKTIYASNPAFNCRFEPNSFDALTVAVPLASGISISVMAQGGMEAGQYTVAYSIANSAGEESPLSVETQIEVLQGGGIAIVGVPIDASSNIRIYATQAHGEELYRIIDTPMIASQFTIGITGLRNAGSQPETRFLEELPFGHFIVAHGSRLLVAFENFLGFSNPFRPHLWDPRHNFIPFEDTITMLASVDGGIFISDSTGVKFLGGDDPEQFTVKHADSNPAIYGSAVTVPGDNFGDDLNMHNEIVVWLSKTGHQAGLPNGSIVRLNPGQLDLPQYSVASGVFTKKDGIKRVLIPVNSNQRNGTGTAIDSETF
jgi:hypothetical protein